VSVFHTYVFTEMPYPYLPPAELMPNNRISVPNSFYDPDAGYELYRKYYDIYHAADELGLDVMVNEHHTTATCTNAVTPLSMAILARETKRARILTLGNPLAHRTDPVRVAEEMATVDVISGGRADVGFVRGVPQESIAVNSSAVDMKDRFWEAVDLIMKAFTTHDGPFNWEGTYFHHRAVNLWPRPYQTPHPPIWSPTTGAASAPGLYDRGITVATMAVGTRGCADVFAAYRGRAAELGHPEPALEKFAYSVQMFVGDTDEEAYREAEKVKLGYKEAGRHPFQFTDPPGYLPPEVRAKVLRARASGRVPSLPLGPPPAPTVAEVVNTPVAELTKGGFMMAGNPDRVFEQMRDFFDAVGGLGNLLPMVQYSTMSYASVERSMQRLAEDVLPRFIAEVYEPTVKGEREIRPVAAAA
jgi:alkanesulfonate monooxygenase SsuD/methylene tetrahydromethanopterin reductase-like flavin-dependent oxidoreductase (luciferase family)